MSDQGTALAARQLVYAVIARAYAEEPDDAFLEALSGDCLSAAVKVLDDGTDARMQEGLEEARAFLARKGGGDPSACIVGLREEYVRTFIGPRSLPAQPWESAYLEGGQPGTCPHVLSVRDAYRMAGFLPVRHGKVADDFIGLEFDFMAKLASSAFASCCEGNAPACRERLGQASDFLREHMLKWVGGLACSIRDHQGPCFYASFTEFAAACIARDAAILPGLVEGIA